MTAYGDLATAVEAVKQGAFEYLLKPFDLDVAQRALERAFDVQPPVAGDAQSPRKPADDDHLVGKSAVMQEVFRQIALVAASDACVHVFGESGSGKELVARAIHRYSRRHAGPFVAVNLASLSESLSESELFGHVRVRLPAPPKLAAACSNRRMAARFSSTKWRTFRSRCKSNCYACWNMANSCRSVRRCRYARIFA